MIYGVNVMGGATPARTDQRTEGYWAAAVKRMRAEFNEMPGLCLTRAQAQRLLGLDRETCDAVIEKLVDIGFLRLGRFGYVRS